MRLSLQQPLGGGANLVGPVGPVSFADLFCDRLAPADQFEDLLSDQLRRRPVGFDQLF